MITHPPLTFTIDVGFSTRYSPPHASIRPDEKVRTVVVVADNHLEAQLTATYMVIGCRRDCAMVTSTTIRECIC